MQIGLVGLGKMGSIIARRLLRAGHDVVGLDLDRDLAAALQPDGLRTADSLAALVGTLTAPRTVWLMLPAGTATTEVLGELEAHLEPGDLVIEGANSNFERTLEHVARYTARDLGLIDVGVSGGIWGLDDGFGLLVGGDPELVGRATPALDAIAARNAWAHVGPIGAGHFAKMVHNAVEYGVMQAYAEGYELLRTPAIDVDLTRVLEVWNAACAVRGWLLGHLVTALQDNPNLDGVPGWAGDSGQGRWAVQQAVDQGVPVPAITAALFARFGSRQAESPAMQAIAALRQQIGGHKVGAHA